MSTDTDTSQVVLPSAALDRDVFRNVIGHFASGVTVITTRKDGTDFGMTASAVSSLSMDPPMLLVCINKRNPTQQAISASRAFAVNILSEAQAELAERFGRPSDDKFAGLERVYGRYGAPVLDEGLAYLECRVVEDVTGGTHTVFLAEVLDAIAREGSPLTYFRGTFGRFLQASDESLYLELREMVLSREAATGRSLQTAELAERLNADRAAVYHALTRLSGEGLLHRESGGGYAIATLDDHVLENATRARLVMELGVAEVTVGSVSPGELAQFRARAEDTAKHIQAGRLLDLGAYNEANRQFHEFHVGLTGNAALLRAYQRLSIEGILMRSFQHETQGSDDAIADHRELVMAYDEADLDRARVVIRRHSERSLTLGRRALEAAGGTV